MWTPSISIVSFARALVRERVLRVRDGLVVGRDYLFMLFTLFMLFIA